VEVGLADAGAAAIGPAASDLVQLGDGQFANGIGIGIGHYGFLNHDNSNSSPSADSLGARLVVNEAEFRAWLGRVTVIDVDVEEKAQLGSLFLEQVA
jgi:hypothetical protein